MIAWDGGQLNVSGGTINEDIHIQGTAKAKLSGGRQLAGSDIDLCEAASLLVSIQAGLGRVGLAGG